MKKDQAFADDIGLMRDMHSAYLEVANRLYMAAKGRLEDTLRRVMEALEEQETAAAQLRSLLFVALGEVVKDTGNMAHNTCPICLDDACDTCAVPCGHALCAKCAQRVQASATTFHGPKCGICRKGVASFIRLYFAA
jgi:hypothetical protein